MRSSDVLPQPLAPRTSQRSPGRTTRSTSSRIVVPSRTNRMTAQSAAADRTASRRKLGRRRSNRDAFVMIVIQLKHIGYTRARDLAPRSTA